MKPATIKNIGDLEKVLLCSSIDELNDYLHTMTYPVTITHDFGKITLATDADRVPFTKVLRFPFTEDEFDDAICGLQCVTDYAMHEGYENTHKDLYAGLALRYAETHGIYEYKVNGSYMEYWSLYENGFYFYRVNLDTNGKLQLCHLEWYKSDGYPIPAFLMTDTGATKYNYFEG